MSGNMEIQTERSFNRVQMLLMMLTLVIAFAGITYLNRLGNEAESRAAQLGVFISCLKNGYDVYRDSADVIILECDNSRTISLTVEEYERREKLNASK